MSGRRCLKRAGAAGALLLGATTAGWAQSVITDRDATTTVSLPTLEVIGSTPLLGSGTDRDKVPGLSNVVTSRTIQRSGAADALRAIDQNVPGAVFDNAAGNPAQPNLVYHGFQVSPLQGTAQGLAIYVNGVRFNTAFGDTVNWDLLPDNAIDSLNIVGANPAFGLNALGGAVNVQLKNGFTYQGGEATLSGGSFGRIGGQFQYGKQIGNVAAYVATTVLHEDGWRDQQSTDVQNFFGDLGWRNDKSELHLSITAANSDLNGPGTSPVELLAAAPRAQFTAPNYINNRYLHVALSGRYEVSDTTSVRGTAYYGYFQQRVRNGNTTDIAPCPDGSLTLCVDPATGAIGRDGNPIADFLLGGPYSQLDQQTTVTNGYGASAQLSNSSELFGRTNKLVGGFSLDGAQTTFSASSQVGGLDLLSRDYIGPGVTVAQPDGSIAPVRLGVSNAYYGLFLADTFDITPRLSATVSGRLNVAQIDLHDQLGTALDGNHSYTRFNPAAGLAYKVIPWLTAYAGYAETNRAPTPAELSCASPAAPCSLANFFVGDPDLKQVVSHTVEAGLRGRFSPQEDTTIRYGIGLFRSELSNDIAFVNSPIQGRAYFQNVGDTRRQGIDASLSYETRRWLAYANYSFTEATYQNAFTAGSQNNPAADASGNISVQAGNILPGVPAHVGKFGVQYRVTDAWTIGLAGVAVSGSYLFGDQANLTKKLPGYVRLDLNTSYRVTPNIELFGLIENVSNSRYSTFGTFSPTGSVFLAQAPGASNPRSYSIAAPIGGYGGLRVTF